MIPIWKILQEASYLIIYRPTGPAHIDTYLPSPSWFKQLDLLPPLQEPVSGADQDTGNWRNVIRRMQLKSL